MGASLVGCFTTPEPGLFEIRQGLGNEQCRETVGDSTGTSLIDEDEREVLKLPSRRPGVQN